TAFFLTTVAPDEVEPAKPSRPDDKSQKESVTSLFRQQPYLVLLAALVGLSTAAVLVSDYLFKSIASARVPHEQLGAFFARTYAVLNALSLLVQLFLAGRVLRRLGVVPALVVLPMLLVLGAGGIVAVGGALLLALVTKGADGSLRYSLNRVAS